MAGAMDRAMDGTMDDGPGRVLCPLAEIEDGEGKGFTMGQGAAARDIFVVRQGGDVFAYMNRCPHQGTPLDWTPDRFISDESGLILCATHGAQFAIADGTCLSGPCIGARLQAVPVSVDGRGRVLLERESGAAEGGAKEDGTREGA